MYKIQLLSVFLAGFFCIAVNGQEFLPGPFPDRVVLTWSDDPRTSQTVNWRTDGQTRISYLEVAEADASPDFPSKAKRIQAETSFLEVDGVRANYHTVEIDSLSPGTLYAYRVGQGESWSEWYHFSTAPEEDQPFSFIYFGDAQNNLKSMWSRVVRQAYSAMPRARFMLHAGDLINRTHNDREWGEWHHAGSFIHAMIPSVPSPGNHEYDRDEEGNLQLDVHWKKTFHMPSNGPEGLESSVYYLDYGNCRIISLNSQEIILDEVSREKQAKWLDRVLSGNKKTWTVITFHHPLFSSKEGRDNPEFRKTFKPIFDKYKVDLVLQGHDHTYGRGRNLPVGVTNTDAGSGTMYVVSVSGPKMYNLTTDRWMDRAASNTQLYQIISIAGDTLSFEAYTATGQLYDAFDIVKGNGKKEWKERVPQDTRERTALPEHYLEKLSKKEIEEYHKVYPERH